MLYAIGDIHGQTAQLDRALGLIAADGGAEAPHVFLGDYTDRGPDSRGVLQRLIDGRDAGRDWTFLVGNHDLMFLRYVTEGRQNDPHIKSGKSWLNPALGGQATLASYGVCTDGEVETSWSDDRIETVTGLPTTDGWLGGPDLLKAARKGVPGAHLDFLRSLKPTHEAEGHLFVHAGIRPGVPLDRQTLADLTWIRDGWLDDDSDHGMVVVHGHTALDAPEHFGNRVDLDAGAGYGRPLVPAVLDDGQWFTLSDDGRTPLRPA